MSKGFGKIKKEFGLVVDRVITRVTIEEIYNQCTFECLALWDTGTTNSILSDHIIKKYNLKTKEYGEIFLPGNLKPQNRGIYKINLCLSENIIIKNLRVGGLQISKVDMIIGMDIIKNGRFFLINRNNKTKLIFYYNL